MFDLSSVSPADLADLRFDYEQYLLEWVDCGVEPLSFEEFVASELR